MLKTLVVTSVTSTTGSTLFPPLVERRALQQSAEFGVHLEDPWRGLASVGPYGDAVEEQVRLATAAWLGADRASALRSSSSSSPAKARGVAALPDNLIVVLLVACGAIGVACCVYDAHDASCADSEGTEPCVGCTANNPSSDVAASLPSAILAVLVAALLLAVTWRESATTWGKSPELLLGDSWRGIGSTLQAYNAAVSELVALPVASPFVRCAAAGACDTITCFMLASFGGLALACARADIADAVDEAEGTVSEVDEALAEAPAEKADARKLCVGSMTMSRAFVGTALVALFLAIFYADAGNP